MTLGIQFVEVVQYVQFKKKNLDIDKSINFSAQLINSLKIIFSHFTNSVTKSHPSNSIHQTIKNNPFAFKNSSSI